MHHLILKEAGSHQFGNQGFLELPADLSQLKPHGRGIIRGGRNEQQQEATIFTGGFLASKPMGLQMTQPAKGWEVQAWAHSRGVRTTDPWGPSPSCQRAATYLQVRSQAPPALPFMHRGQQARNTTGVHSNAQLGAHTALARERKSQELQGKSSPDTHSFPSSTI